MHWRIHSFVELEHLAEEERREVLRQALPARWTARVICRSLFLSLIAAVPFSAPLVWSFPSGFSVVVFLILWMACAAAVYQVMLIRIRGQLLIYLERHAAKDALPMCLHCGYSTEGLSAPRCPECGHALSKEPP